MIIDLEHPCFQVLIDEYVETKDLEAVAFTLGPSTTELHLLFYQLEWLKCKQTFLAHLAYLLKQIICIDIVLISQLLKHMRKRPLT